VKKIRQKFKHFAASKLDLPKDVIFDMPRITVIGSYQLYIENHRGVIQFDEHHLHLRLSKGEVKITGDQLVIRAILPEEVFIEGLIQDIQFIS